MNLPTTKTGAKKKVEASRVFLYGEPGVGKTTFAAHNPLALLLLTERGADFLPIETYRMPITTWDGFTETIKDIIERRKSLPYKTLVVDTIDNLFGLWTKKFLKNKKIEHQGDLKWGKGYALHKDGFLRPLKWLLQQDIGVWFISHAKFTRNEKTQTTLTEPSLHHSVLTSLLGEVDFIFLARVRSNGSRVIETQPNKEWRAKDRSGKLPPQIELNFKNLQKLLKGEKNVNISK